MTVKHLFSTPLYSSKFKKHEEYKDKLETLLYQDINKSKDKNSHDSHWGCDSYQTFLWGNGQDELQSEMIEYINEFLISLGYSPFPYKICSSWFNMYGPNQYKEEHDHLPNLFSGLYVIKFDPEIHTGLDFPNPRRDLDVLHRTFNLYPTNFSSAWGENPVKLEEGNLYIFPANLRHKVKPQPATLDKNNYRITFTFNISI